MITTENLKRISSYAKEIGKSVTWVYKLAEQKEIKIIQIDGVNFVKTK